MKKLLLLFLTFSLFTPNCKAQKIIPKIEKVFLDKTDQSRNSYTILHPGKLPLEGYIFLIPGFGESAENVLEQTDLPNQLVLKGILTIIPTFQDGVLSFGVDRSSQESFKIIVNDVRLKYNLKNEKFYVGGFSIGGSCALKYAENSKIKPAAVFVIDSPIDLEKLYDAAKRDIRLSKEGEANPENLFIIEKLEKLTGGIPITHLSDYYSLSPYSFSDATQTAVKQLVTVPLRIYTEPDVQWWLKERAADFTSMNATFSSAMINELNRLGNQKAELITTQNKGYRKPNQERHPHSWSIVDNDELIQWLQKQK